MLKKMVSLSLLLMSFVGNQDLFSAEQHSYTIINAVKLKRWIDEEKNIFIFDARTAPYDDGKRLPKASLLPCDSSTDMIQASIPSKDSLVVVYCSCIECPASKILAEHLVQLGYDRVYKYPGGIAEWKEKGYPVIKTKK